MIGVRGSEVGALLGFAERQLYVYKRYWVWEVVWLFYNIVSVLSIGFLASGLDMLGAGNAGFDVPKNAIDDAVAYVRRCYSKEYGTFQYWIDRGDFPGANYWKGGARWETLLLHRR